MSNRLAKVDLNLLKALHALLEERSVTRAAQRLFITQSGMSKSLNRLREQFEDPLLVRGTRGQILTPRAEELLGQLEEIFARVESCFSPSSFDPILAQGRICIAAPEQFSFVLVPELLQLFRKTAPNLTLDSQHLMDNHLEMLATGALDFVISRDLHFPTDFNARHIYTAVPMCWFHKGHVFARKRNIDLADVCSYSFVTLRSQTFSPQEVRTIRGAIAAAGLTEKVTLDTSLLLNAIDALAKTDAIMIAPDYLSRLPILRHTILARQITHIPIFSHFRTNLSLVQHKRTLNSRLHQWITNEIVNVFSS